MGTTPTDSHHHHHMQFNQSTPTNRIGNLCSLISDELLADVGFDQQLIIEILLRLPVKSLSKFKCVSKSWLSLISSPQFVRSHYSASPSEADPCLNSQLLCTMVGGINQFSLYSALYEPSVVHVSATDHPGHKHNPFIVGIVNGLVCLLGADGLRFWNPVLRKSKHLPNPNPPDFPIFMNHAYGFGYDESNDDYKVVFAEDVFTPRNGNNMAVKVYSLLTDSWRIIENFNSGIHIHWCGTYANGKIHWIVRADVSEWKIVSLDMLSEKYGELQLPHYEAGVSDLAIGVSGGWLFALCHYDEKRMDLWVMDKYEVVEVWSKVVSIPCDNVHFQNPYSMHRVFCLCILRNDDIVLSAGPDLLVYHSKHNEFRKIDLGRFRHCSFHVYVESLVSPHGSGLVAQL